MAVIERIRCQWSGFTGSPGLTTFYTDDAINFLPLVRTFFDAIKTLLPSAVTVSFEAFGARINDNDGSLNGSWSAGSTPAPVTGTIAGSYAAPAGVLVNWNTNTVVNGRFLRGKTFLVPSAALSSNGTVNDANIVTLTAAAVALLAGTPDMLVWHRPKTDPFVAGSSAAVLNPSVPDKIVVLRSRRD